MKYPCCTRLQTLILQMRAQGKSFRQISRITKLSPRKTHDAYLAALRRVVRYMDQEAFFNDAHQ